MMKPDYNSYEMMICTASKFLEDGKTVAVGTGAPCAAAMLAQKTHAPNLVIFFEAGGIDPLLPRMPISVGDSRTFYMANSASGMVDMMSTCARGLIDYAFLGGAQIDKYGNLNSTVIGEHQRPKVRFPGSGGANDFASFCWRTLVLTPHNAKRFVEKVDFLTTPGYLDGPGKREEAGLPPNSGPFKVITDMGVLSYDKADKTMVLDSMHPGITLEQIKHATGFELSVSENLAQTETPDDEYLRALRTEIDPDGIVIGR